MSQRQPILQQCLHCDQWLEQSKMTRHREAYHDPGLAKQQNKKKCQDCTFSWIGQGNKDHARNCKMDATTSQFHSYCSTFPVNSGDVSQGTSSQKSAETTRGDSSAGSERHNWMDTVMNPSSPGSTSRSLSKRHPVLTARQALRYSDLVEHK